VGQNHWEEINFQPRASKGGENYGWAKLNGTKCFPMTGPDDTCPIVGTLPAGEYPHEVPYPGAQPLKDGHGCSVEGLGVANYGGMKGVYLVGDWCSGRVFGLGWNGTQWILQELAHTNLQFTAGGYDESGNVMAVNCNCFYTSDRGPAGNPPGALWRIVPASEVPAGAETARTVSASTEISQSGPFQLRHPLDNKPLQLNLMPADRVTPAVEQFLKTGSNPYNGNAAAIAAGKKLYAQWCASCHLADGTGRMGSNLTDAQVTYPRSNTDAGIFEVVYAGGTGAMQAFGNRIPQDDILKIAGFVNTLRKK
jgi:cytochrome c(L)